jgi:hypothetical protein
MCPIAGNRSVKRQTVLWAYEMALTRIFAATQHFVFCMQPQHVPLFKFQFRFLHAHCLLTTTYPPDRYMALLQLLRGGSTPSDAPHAILSALSNAAAHVKQLDALTQGLLRRCVHGFMRDSFVAVLLQHSSCRKLRGSTAIGTAVGTFFRDILKDVAGSGVLATEVKIFVADIASVLRQAASTGTGA